MQSQQHQQQQQHHRGKQQECDRRRSRAARTLLMNKTLPILQQYNAYPITTPSTSHHELMQTYKAFLTDLMTNSKTCILNPKLDPFWNEENQYTTVRSRYKRQTLHKCGLCGKTFLSMYYLDLHMESTHQNDGIHKANQICPANQLCNLLGGTLCDREAINSEPYYAPGIYSPKNNGYDSQTILRDFQRRLHTQPCNETALQESRQYCIESINNCFAGMDGLIEDMKGILCETQTCHYHLHMLHSMVESVHIWKGEWDRHHDEMNQVSFAFILVFFVGCVFMVWRRGASLSGFFRQKPKRKFDLNKRKKLE